MFKRNFTISTVIAISAAICVAFPVDAMDDRPSLVSRAATTSDKIRDLVDATNGDFNQNGVRDLVVLARTPGSNLGGDLIILEDHFEDGANNMVRLRGYLTVGLGVGEIKLTSETSFSVTHGNLNGRNSWSETLHLAFRDGEYVLAGQTVRSHDGFEENLAYYCDLNLLTGRFVFAEGPDVANANFKTGRRSPLAIQLDSLPSYLAETADQRRALCGD